MKPPECQMLALTFADGTVGITAFVTCEYNANDTPRWTQAATPANIEGVLAQLSLSLDPVKVPIKGWRFIQPDEVPEDRTYRNALRDTGTGLDYDMAHAREIHRDLLRQARAPELLAKDVAYCRADELGDAAEKQAVAAEKQALRDVTADPAIEAALTTDDLKAIWPLGLTKQG